MTDDRSAALLIRVWQEDGVEGFRARLTSTGEPGVEDRTVALAASPGELLDAVRHWLDVFLGSGTATD